MQALGAKPAIAWKRSSDTPHCCRPSSIQAVLIFAIPKGDFSGEFPQCLLNTQALIEKGSPRVTELSRLLEFFRSTDPVLIGIGAIGFLILILIFRRPRDRSEPLQRALEVRETELRDAQRSSSRAEALAEERKTEIDRLNGDLSKLRLKLDDEARQSREDSAKISALETELRGEREEAQATASRHGAVLKDWQTRAAELQDQLTDVQKSASAKADNWPGVADRAAGPNTDWEMVGISP